jgi:mannose-6-phosphate isomerase
MTVAQTATGAQVGLFPLRFDPIYEYRPWGGRNLGRVLSEPLPGDGPIGEAWVLSDRQDHQSRVSEGPFSGWAFNELLARFPEQMLGEVPLRAGRFPLLLKFLDTRDLLSVQVHPTDRQTKYLPPGDSGKTEAWVVLEAGPQSIVYAGLRPGTTRESLQRAVDDGEVAGHLASFTPEPGDAVFITAGTVHAVGGSVVFEISQNSDVTFRLYDWGHIDANTGRHRELQVDQAIDCTDFAQAALGPVAPVVEATTPALRERLFDCEHFRLWRISGQSPFTVGAAGVPRLLVCIEGEGRVEYGHGGYNFARGGLMFLPAALDPCLFRPTGPVRLLEVALPELAPNPSSEPQ